jgi:nicotinamidase-related amidase
MFYNGGLLFNKMFNVGKGIMTNKYRIDVADALVVVIDVQDRLSSAMPQGVVDAMIQKTGILMDAAILLDVPVIVTEQYPKGLGCTVAALEERIAERSITKVSKLSFSCWGEPTFVEKVEAQERKVVILCGQETHVCVLQTALDLLEQGYKVFVAGDAVCSRDEMNWQFALDEMRQAGCVAEPVESILFKMLGVAGSAEFKAISKLVK